MSDPVAAKSSFMCGYMSNHPDTLVAYAKWFGKISEPVSSAKMTAIDSNGMDLVCTLKSGGTKDVRVKFSPPLSGYDEIKPRLLGMKADAQQGLGMIKAPRIESFVFPNTTSAYVGTAFAVFVTGVWFGYGKSLPFLSSFADKVVSYVGSTFFNYVAPTLLVLHTLESVYTLSLCLKSRTGPLVASMYVFATITTGFMIWVDLRRRIQKARIDSVMKVE